MPFAGLYTLASSFEKSADKGKEQYLMFVEYLRQYKATHPPHWQTSETGMFQQNEDGITLCTICEVFGSN